jgi:endonuclease YncB( thermonuclease family)
VEIVKTLVSWIVGGVVGAIALGVALNQIIHKAETPAEKGLHGSVVKVADGDTLTVLLNGKKERTRLCGIDAPEKAQPLGPQSQQNLERLALGKEVQVVPVERDRYGRLVAEVIAGETNLNIEQLSAGLAYHYAQYSGKCPSRELLVNAEGTGKQKGVGVWIGGNYQKPWDYRKDKRGQG